MTNYKSEKVNKNTYRARRPKKRMQLNAYQTFCVVQHKNRWIVALTEGFDREFKSCHTINRTQALQMINFLAEYINLVKPTDATELHARIKVSSNRIIRSANELTGIAMSEKE